MGFGQVVLDPSPTDRTERPLKRIRVLSVDDHAFLAEGLRARLAMEPDMEVVGHAPKAEGLVALVRQLGVTVVLLDIEMPGPDPFEAVADLRRRCPEVRTIILSAYVRDRYVDATVKAGAWGYLAKSDEPDAIIRSIREVATGAFAFGPLVRERCRLMGREASLTPDSAEARAGGAGGAAPHAGPPSFAEVPVHTGGETAFAAQPPTMPTAVPGSGLPTSRLASLTPRELQVLRFIGKGLSRTDIAKAIFRSPKTVDAHRSSIMEKLGIHDRVELARFAIREGLVEL
jgi:DNA-binding NarL/FixJ family response regulator